MLLDVLSAVGALLDELVATPAGVVGVSILVVGEGVHATIGSLCRRKLFEAASLLIAAR